MIPIRRLNRTTRGAIVRHCTTSFRTLNGRSIPSRRRSRAPVAPILFRIRPNVPRRSRRRPCRASMPLVPSTAPIAPGSIQRRGSSCMPLRLGFRVPRRTRSLRHQALQLLQKILRFALTQARSHQSSSSASASHSIVSMASAQRGGGPRNTKPSRARSGHTSLLFSSSSSFLLGSRDWPL